MPVDELTRAGIRESALAGLSVPALAREFGVNPGTVRKILDDAGVARLHGDAPQVHPFDAVPWMDDALCVQTDPEAFFPEKGGSARAARDVCRKCPVKAECLAYALEHRVEFGVWGGFTAKELVALRRSGEQVAS